MKIRLRICLTVAAAVLASGIAIAQTGKEKAKPSPTPTPAITPAKPEVLEEEVQTPAGEVVETPGEAPVTEKTADEIAQEETKIKESVAETDARATAEEKKEEIKATDDAVADESEMDPQPLPGPAGPAPEPLEPALNPNEGMGYEDSLPTEQLSADEIPDPNLLIPDDVVPPGDIPPAPPVVAESKFEKERKLRARYQEVKLQAGKDQAIREMKEKAAVARTDEDKRAALREYYRMLFAKMVSIDPELQRRCEVMEEAYLRRVGQYRIEPTIPLNPPPTPEPLEN